MMKFRIFSLLSILGGLHCSADLVAHWPLDTDASDATGNGYDGAIIDGTVNFGQDGANGNTGSSASFPDNGHIDVPFNAALNPESFTIALWANPTATADYQSPITSRDDVGGGTSTHGFILYNDINGNWDFWTGDGDPGWHGSGGPAVVTETWVHLALTYDANTETKTLWVDGEVAATETAPNLYSPNGTVEMENLHIGSGADLGDSFHFAGNIDDVGLWDEALDQDTIKNVMENGIANGKADPALGSPSPIGLVLNGAVQTFEIEITNKGENNDLTISGAEFLADNPNFSVTSFPDSAIAPDDSANIVISFDPAGSNGEFEGILEIESNDSLNPVREIILQGSIHDPMIVSTNEVDLGSETTGSFDITNDGASRTLNITSLEFTGPDADKFSASGPDTLAAGGTSGTIEITFDSGGEEGNFAATLEITTDDPLVPVTSVTVKALAPFSNILVAWWPLDVDGTDASGNGFDGTFVGAPTQAEGANGATGGSLDFDGSSRIDVPFDQDLNPEDFTVTLWANASTTDGFASPITSRDDVGGGTSTHGFIIYNDNGGSWNFWTGDGDPGWDTLAGPAVQTDTWTHLAITFDSASGTKTLYVDGVEAATETADNQYSQNGTVEMEALHIGAGQDDGLNFWFVGSIDDVGLFRTALSAEEIGTIISNGVGGFTGAVAGLKITDITRDPDTGFVSLTFNSLNGADYIIESSPDLSFDSWEELDDSFNSQGETTTFVDTTVPDGTTKLFYRVRQN